MNFKSISFGAAVATIVVSGSCLVSAPAEAAIIAGSSIQLGAPIAGGVFVPTVSSPGGPINFVGFNPLLPLPVRNQATAVVNTSGTFEILGTDIQRGLRFVATNATSRILDLPLNSASSIASPIANFFTARLFTNSTFSSTPVAFDLNSFNYNVVTGIGNGAGLLRFGSDSILADIEFTTQIIGSQPRSYSATITAIPTPFLLPGLMALGAGAIRKRKQAVAQEVEA